MTNDLDEGGYDLVKSLHFGTGRRMWGNRGEDVMWGIIEQGVK